jgi:Family of unknown function (DUF5522)
MLFDANSKLPIETTQLSKQTDGALVADEDYYLEGSAMVFTATYHQRRGYCCGNGCRHCPYKSIETA